MKYLNRLLCILFLIAAMANCARLEKAEEDPLPFFYDWREDLLEVRSYKIMHNETRAGEIGYYLYGARIGEEKVFQIKVKAERLLDQQGKDVLFTVLTRTHLSMDTFDLLDAEVENLVGGEQRKILRILPFKNTIRFAWERERRIVDRAIIPNHAEHLLDDTIEPFYLSVLPLEEGDVLEWGHLDILQQRVLYTRAEVLGEEEIAASDELHKTLVVKVSNSLGDTYYYLQHPFPRRPLKILRPDGQIYELAGFQRLLPPQ